MPGDHFTPPPPPLPANVAKKPLPGGVKRAYNHMNEFRSEGYNVIQISANVTEIIVVHAVLSDVMWLEFL